ncbi:Single-stranded DNA-binding protein why1, chloroplastic [Dionaea muscipula]
MAQSLSSPCAAYQNPRTTLHHRFTAVGAVSSSSIPLRPFSKLGNLNKAKLSVKCRQSEYFKESPPFSSMPQKDPFPISSPSAGRVFVGHSIYKGKAVLSVDPRPPEFVPLESGKFKISREGYIFLQFAPAAGLRQYDWSRKQVFSLSVTEIGTLINLGSGESCEFIHDPHKGRSDEGKVMKVLKVEPLRDASGHFFSLSVQNKILNKDENIYIPISKAEFTVLATAFKFILPYLLGWHTFGNLIGPDVPGSGNRSNSNSRGTVDYEWSR